MSKYIPTPTKFGRPLSVAEPFRRQTFLVTKDASTFKEVDYTKYLGPVFDQEDLHAQGIDVSKLVAGADASTDALGSCTSNAGNGCLVATYNMAGKALPKVLGYQLSNTDAVADEEAVIVFYHNCTDQTGDPSQEWPPTDCGSTGLYVCSEFERLDLISSHKTGATGLDLLDLLQDGPVIEGTPWFNSWMQPDSDGFVDGDGSTEALQDAIDSGVAGGHETLVFRIAQLAVARNTVDRQKTVLEVRNSWSKDWNKEGNFFIHLSTLDQLSQYVDYKSFVL